MTPDEHDACDRWGQEQRAKVQRHTPRTPEDVAFLQALETELDAAPSVQDYYRTLEAPYPRPMPDQDVQDAAQRAIEDLAGQRRMAWLGDGAIQIHLIASLICDLQVRLDEAIVLAADQEIDLADIAQLAGLSADQTRQIIANIDPENDLAN
ncbi:MAG: hypothetical protein ACRDQF_06105 [Thermocrispum sp.]